MWRLKKDGEWKGPKCPTYSHAWIELLRSQPQSTSYAVDYEGWEIVRCSPLTRYGVKRP
jgi:hypothetical protein